MTDEELQLILKGEVSIPSTDRTLETGMVEQSGTPTNVGERSEAARAAAEAKAKAAAAKAAEEAAKNAEDERIKGLNDPFGSLDLSDPDAIAAAQANDIELQVDDEKVRESKIEDERQVQEDLTNRLSELAVQIDYLKSQTIGFPVGVTQEERMEVRQSAEALQQQLAQAQAEYDSTQKMLVASNRTLEELQPVQNIVDEKPIVEPGVFNVYNRESGPAFPERRLDRFKTRQKLREAETGEKTLSRFFKDDFVGNISEQAFNLPVKNRVTVPLADGGEAVFTDSEAKQRNREGIFGIPGIELQNSAIGRIISTPIEFYGELAKIPFAEANIGIGVGGGEYSGGRVIHEAGLAGKTGGVMFTPTAPKGRPIDEERLTQQIETRQNIIAANDAEIESLNQEIESRRSGSRIGDLTGRIALLEDDSDQKRAELRQLDRVLTAYMQ